MKQIINGRLYDTDQATLICEADTYDNNNWIATHKLYQTQKGTWFLAITNNYTEVHHDTDNLALISLEAAKAFVERHGSPDLYISLWGAEAG